MIFQVGEMILWNPALRLGRIFKGEAEVIASAFGVPSGLGTGLDRSGRREISGKQSGAGGGVG
jgi:hypothetical protein